MVFVCIRNILFCNVRNFWNNLKDGEDFPPTQIFKEFERNTTAKREGAKEGVTLKAEGGPQKTMTGELQDQKGPKAFKHGQTGTLVVPFKTEVPPC